MSWSLEIEILISRLHDPVTVLGFGRRIGIWMQGCTVGCSGCIARDTWDFDQSRAVTVEEVVAWCESRLLDGRDGITISGGEPFDQPEALAELLKGLNELAALQDGEVDVLVYSGRNFRQLEYRHTELLRQIDAVIAGPFMQHRPTDKPWMGSANQELIALTQLGQKRYADLLPGTGRKRVQFQVEDGRIWMIGVPDIGEMESIRTGLESRGIELEGLSWQA